MHMQPVRKRSAMAFWVLFSCAVITASARPLELLTSDETRKLISKWNLDHAFGKAFDANRYNGVVMQYATKEDIDAEFPHVTPLHRRALFAKIQELKTHQRRRAESKDKKPKDTNSKESDSKETKSKESDSKETKPAPPPVNFDEYSGVSINREKAWLTFGKNDHIKMFNTPDGTLKIMATKVDFLTKILTMNSKPLGGEGGSCSCDALQKRVEKLEKSKPTGGDDSTKSPYLVHYRLNGSAKDSSDNGFHGKWEGKEDYAEGGARFDGSSRIVVNALKKYKWGDKFSVGVWFKRTSSSHFQGIVNNGYYGSGSFEIRMGDQNGGTFIGGGVLTASHKKAWDHKDLKAALNTWHHVIMTYDGSKLDFYLNGMRWKDSTTDDKGPLVVQDTPLFIGQAGTGTSKEFFKGIIRDVKIWRKALSVTEVYKEFGINADMLQAYYPLTKDANDAGPRALHGKWEGSAKFENGAAYFNGGSRIVVDGLRNQQWGDKFTVGVWFKRTSAKGFQGIVNNGYYGSGSFEIRMGDGDGGTMIGGGVLTASHKKAWDHVNLKAALNTWHHVIMTYDGSKLDFYLNGMRWKDSTTDDKGPLVVKNTPLFIGQAGTGTSKEFFNGYIKDVKIWSKAFSPSEVYKEFGINDDMLQAYYPLTKNANDAGPRGLHGKWSGNAKYADGGAFFNGGSKIVVDGFKNHQWGDKFSVGCWFKRTSSSGYRGIVNNGYYKSGSFEIRMGSEGGGTALGGGVLTGSNAEAWDQTSLPAPLNKWHHVIMTYDGSKLDMYLNKVTLKASNTRDKGKMVIKNTPLVIGQAGPGTSGEFFYGYIKEVKIWARALSKTDVAKEFELTK